MTPQEQDMINGLIERVGSTRLDEKDPEAERTLQQGLGRNPDSLYILAQTVLVQQYALDQAQRQIADAKAQIDQLKAQQGHPKTATSFLGNLFGGGSSDRTSPPPPPPQGGSQYAPVPGYAAAPANYAPSGYVSGAGSPQFGAPAQGGGFLRGAMQTAAGVAAGALAFEGVESLMHGFGREMTGMGGGGRPEEIVNNYYGDGSSGRDESRFQGDDRSADNSDPGSNVFTDGDDRDNFAGSGDQDSGDSNDDGSFADDSDVDDSSFDDGGGDSTSDDSSGDSY